MISLQDEIKKFQKLVYNKQLAQFVTVDQMFVGGGITMQSIIHESNFTVEELKKMNSVFLNYCKLNQKIYTKIVEHELSIHSEQARLNALVNSIDRKLEDGLKKIRHLHEDTLTQNQKSHNFLASEIQPVKTLLATKVDISTFSAQMKKFLDQYDDGGTANQEDTEGKVNSPNEVIGLNNAGSPISSYPRKKGKVSYDQFYKFREELDLLLKTSEQKATDVAKTSFQAKDLILKYILQINTLQSETIQHKNEIYKLQNGQIQQSNQLTTAVNKLNLQLNSRLNDQVWNNKFDGFMQKQIKPLMNKLQQRLKINKEQFEAYKDEIISKFKTIDSQAIRNKTFQEVTKRQNQRMRIQIQRLSKVFQQNETKNQQRYSKLSENLEITSNQLNKSISQADKRSQKGLKQLQTALNNLSSTISQAVVKDVNKKFDGQLKLIESDIRKNRESLKQLNNDLGFVSQQIKNIKDVLSHKANFSDIIHHVQKKADKQDFKELQHRLHETSQNFYPKNLNESINTSKLQKTENGSTRRIPSLSRTSKTLLVPPFTPNNKNQKVEIDTSTKLFMCGFQSHIGQAKKQSNQNSRRKSMKSSAAVTGDFIL